MTRATAGLVVFLVACGAPEGRTSTERATENGSSSGSSERESGLPEGCPPTYGRGVVDCAASLGLSCAYPEGRCYCGQPRSCSGVAPLPEPDTWQCEPHPPPCPEVGTACRAGEVGCSPWCCGMAVVCVNGVWTQEAVPCPP